MKLAASCCATVYVVLLLEMGSASAIGAVRTPRGNDRGQLLTCPGPENPCRNGGTCTMNGTTVTCYCTPGYTGQFCTEGFDECETAPCRAGSTCRTLTTTYKCECPPGYSGPLCEREDDLCVDNICQNGGTCTTVDATTECQCPPGYTGEFCQQSFVDCDVESFCLYGGTCMMFPDLSKSCVCTPGCTGARCEIATEDAFVRAYKPCEMNFCMGGGTCVEVLNRFQCIRGDECILNCPDEMYSTCTEDPCQNNGICQVLQGTETFYCQCSSGSSGPICDRGSDPVLCFGLSNCGGLATSATDADGCCTTGVSYRDGDGNCSNCSDQTSNGGGDPHFSIILNDGKRLCYSVQGEKEHVFNLITCNEFLLNAEFVPDSKRDEVTWMGNIGVVIQKTLKYENSKVSHFRFDAQSRTVYVGDTIMFDASSIEELTSDNGHISIVKSNRQTSHPRHPSVRVHLKDVGLNFTVKFEDEHLDWFWHSPIGGNNSHGLIGQFYRKGVDLDEVRKLLIMPGKPPVPVEWKPVWRFMERAPRADKTAEQHCWVSMNPGNQGKNLIDGHYSDYIVENVLSSGFKFDKQY